MTAPTDMHRWRHDLKNQLGIVLGFSELVLSELDAASPLRPDLTEIHTAAQRAIELMERMPESGDAGEKDPA